MATALWLSKGWGYARLLAVSIQIGVAATLCHRTPQALRLGTTERFHALWE